VRILEARGRPERYEVGIDDDTSVILSARMISDLGLHLGAPVNADQRLRIMLAASRLGAYDRAVGMLARGPRSMFELRRRLAAKGEDSAAIAWALGKLESVSF